MLEDLLMTVANFNDLEKRTYIDASERDQIKNLLSQNSPLLIRDIQHFKNTNEKDCFYYHRMFSSFCRQLNRSGSSDPYGNNLTERQSKVYVDTEFRLSQLPNKNNSCQIYIRAEDLFGKSNKEHQFRTMS